MILTFKVTGLTPTDGHVYRERRHINAVSEKKMKMSSKTSSYRGRHHYPMLHDPHILQTCNINQMHHASCYVIEMV